MGMDSKAGSWLLLAVLALSAATAVHGSLMAIDLGSEFLKVCLVKPGRTPISIVVNEMSKRKSPALVGLVEEDRVVGEEAFSFAIRYPSTIYSGLRNLLGRSAEDAEVQRLLKDNMLLYKVTDHPLRGTAAIQVNETASYLVEELVVSAFIAAAVLYAG
jgi:hypoxia up-regulated 1